MKVFVVMAQDDRDADCHKVLVNIFKNKDHADCEAKYYPCTKPTWFAWVEEREVL